jgi:cytochrome oxidase Cu insertion factor (SCO1/SenC/PrrC family)
MSSSDNDGTNERRKVLGGIAAAAGLLRLAATPAQASEIAHDHDHVLLDRNKLLGPGQFPEAIVETQEGEKVRLYADLIKGKVVTINFMTIANEEAFPISKSLVEIAKLLGGKLGKDARMISITADPANDTSEQLRAFAEQLGAPQGWYFVRATDDSNATIATRLYPHGRRLGGATTVDLVHYGNEAVGLWAAFPALIQADDAAARIRSVMNGERPTGPLKQAGPRRLDEAGPDYHHREI